MNLVKIQEDLKGMPMQVLQQYANGANPEVPPYVAAAELQRRQATMQRAGLSQGATGPQPSVKEQLEQTLGLGALQAQQQAQGAQQLAQQAGQQSMRVPEGVPQPQAQPRAPVGMARGGVASLPVPDTMFGYASGGVIGFSEGGTTTSREIERILKKHHLDRTREENAKLEQAGYKLVKRTIPHDSAIRQMDAALGGTTLGGGAGRGSINPPMATAPQPKMPAPHIPQAPASGGITQLLQGAPKAAPAAKSAPAVKPTPAAAPQMQLPTDDNESAANAVLRGALNAVPEATAAQGIGDEREMASAYGLDKPQFQGSRAAMDALTADYNRRMGSRGLETFITAFGNAGAGYGGVGQGYLAAKQAQNVQDDAYHKQMADFQRGVEGDELDLAKGRYGAAGDAYKGRRTSADTATRSRVEAAAEMSKQAATRADKQADRAHDEKMRNRDNAAALERARVGATSRSDPAMQMTPQDKLAHDRLRKALDYYDAELREPRVLEARRAQILALQAAAERDMQALLARYTTGGGATAPAPSATAATQPTAIPADKWLQSLK